MRLQDIAKVRINWMTEFTNDPGINIILKRDKAALPWKDFRFTQHGDLFFGELDGEVHYVVHDSRDHHGFGGAHYVLNMADDWVPSPLRCSKCRVEGRQVHLFGPWSGSASVSSRIVKPVVHVGVLDGKWRLSISSPDYLQRLRRQGNKTFEGTYCGMDLTLDFCREVIDAFAPHCEMYEGDYGWYPMIRGGEPKNPRNGRRPSNFDPTLSDEQMMVCAR